MPQTPPPYYDVTGIARSDMKINSQETIAEYDGSARPGELVVDLTTYDLYIGNANGNLNGFTGGGGTNYANSNAVAYGQVGWAGNIIPSANNVYNLGSPTSQWKSIYVGANTLYIGDTPVSADATGLVVNGNAVLTANTSISGNVIAENVLVLSSIGPSNPSASPAPTLQGFSSLNAQSANLTGNVTAGNISTGGKLNVTGNASVAGIVNVVGNIYAGNIIPSANNVYSLGSPDMLWANLYVSSNTIYFGTVPVSVTETGMEIGNSAVVTAGTPTSGDITADTFIGNLVLGADTYISSTNNLNLYASDGSQANVGNAATNGSDISMFGGNGGNAIQDVGNNIYTAARDGGDTIIFGGDAGNNAGNTALGGNGGSIYLYAGESTNLVTYGGVFLRGSQTQIQSESKFWDFSRTGNLTLPSDSTANIRGNTISVLATSLNLQANVANITLSVLNNAVSHNFTFDNTGNLTVPETINSTNANAVISGFAFEGAYVSTAGTVQGGLTRTNTYLVSELIDAAIGAGWRTFVTDADSTTFANLAVGGGSNNVPVYSDGTDWRIG